VDYREALEIASSELISLEGHTIDVLTVSRPRELQGVMELSKIVSKLSPIIGNLIEYAIARHLNEIKIWPKGCQWIRQDPGFPDTLLKDFPGIEPGIEVKTWFPLSTEITARFRDSQTHLATNHIKVVMVAWMLEEILYGKPKILDIWVGESLDVAKARDSHYHNPPYYIVMEPEDTSSRTRNLQQTNCNGFKFQGSQQQLEQAVQLIDSWGKESKDYCCDRDYQELLRELMGSFPYRLDTNFAKMDRIVLPSLESFKASLQKRMYLGRSIQSWTRAINSLDETALFPLIDASHSNLIN
jgi:hypothetical protein